MSSDIITIESPHHQEGIEVIINNHLSPKIKDTAKAQKSKRLSNTRKMNPKDLLNYKGNFADEVGKTTEVRYSCPDTGAHFEFTDMCAKLEILSNWLAEKDASFKAN